jgi:hypothetical protein
MKGASQRNALGRWPEVLCLALVITGVALRLFQWWSNRSLWLDEAFLAVNLLDRDIPGLLRPLEFDQSAPALFLVATKLLTVAFGFDERVLRVLPLVASIAALVITWRLVRRTLPGWTAPVVVVPLALVERMVYYGQELKPYALDVLVVVTLLALTHHLFEKPSHARQRFTWLWVAGALALFASHPAPFPLAGAGLAVAWGVRQGALPLSRRTLVVAAAGWGILFVTNYALFIRPNYDNPLMQRFWAFASPGPLWTTDGLRSWFELVDAYLAYLGYGGVFKIAICGLSLTGVAASLFRPTPALLAIALALIAYGLAVAAGMAPFHGRLALFVAPMLLLMVAHGLSLAPRGPLRLGAQGLALLLLLPAFRHVHRSTVPYWVQDPRAVISTLVTSRASDEPIYVLYGAEPSLRFYAPALAASGGVHFAVEHRVWDDPGTRDRPPSGKLDVTLTMEDLRPLTRSASFWILFGHLDAQEPELLAAISSTFNCVPVEAHKRRGASAIRFEKDPAERL